MFKFRRSLAVIGLVCFSGTALAMPLHRPMPPGGPGGPMMGSQAMGPQVRWHRAIPMLLPLAEMRSYALHLNDHQVSTLAVWRNRHMRVAGPLIRRLRADRSALRAALMEGAHKGALRNIMRRLNSDRTRMLRLKVAQVRVVHRTLSSDQWQKLLVMYRRMHAWAMGGRHR